MVLEASDELRHSWDDDPLWRESWYFNFSDPANKIGAWIYFWVLPNQEKKTGMLVSFYHGVATSDDSNTLAWESPGHLYQGPGGSWVYCYRSDAAGLIEEDLDDVEFAGLKMRRQEPLKRYHLGFEDEDNASFHLNCDFMTRPWDFRDNIHPTPSWLAKNRYHRGWKADGELVIGSNTYRVKTSGDSDHSWGTRDSTLFGQNNLKTYALQRADGSLSVKAQLLGPPGRELPRGYIAVGEDMAAVTSIEETSSYTAAGEMYNISLRVSDVTGRIVETHMDRMFGAVSGGGTGGGYEGAGLWNAEGWGDCAGLASCWWAKGVTRDQLHRGESGTTLGV